MSIIQKLKRPADNKGFTLIELLIAMAVASIMMTLIVGAYWTQTRISREQQMMIDMQQNMRLAMNFLKWDLMMAGYGLDNDDTFETADAGGLEFSYVADRDGIDNNNDGTTDEGDETETVFYELYDAHGDGDSDLRRELRDGPGVVPDPRGQAIALDIEELEFFYTLADGTQTSTPANLEDIRAVGISFIARTAHETGSRGNQTYTSFSGTDWSYNDGFQRQIITGRVQCRNMIED
ncbi:MAG: prepilin-type N-terminal cleavage/methylation domain-containing protein [Desulfobacterales bacterium]|nr:prepilin-type N-terminal cleavage/methylation domain-containing protein [Desulfobacterales bacterium]